MVQTIHMENLNHQTRTDLEEFGLKEDILRIHYRLVGLTQLIYLVALLLWFGLREEGKQTDLPKSLRL